MKPQEKEAVSVQEIRNNPVEGEQKALRVQREGVLGWLSYIGYMCVVSWLIWTVSQITLRAYISFPFYEHNHRGILGVGLILSALTIWKSKYPLSQKTRIILVTFLGAFVIFVLPFCYALDYDYIEIVDIEISRIAFYSTAFLGWLYLIGWYLRYFYHKAKDGYKYVWLKVVLSTVLPFVPLLWCAGGIHEIDTGVRVFE